ncbi:HAMP domain-containing histidine kinase [Jatrophihabitans telluris]|uniref:histidine kinase n=1 Tax=Jatrophihabitans telluris TaxID=2038343 RepID=A0ABY4QTZ6_9ACTN|nr:HAMP domain-containing sensor histidine kinase [Jatrophihabitans telluris]UQX87161.1 HAMP domain-containing histidine kinase [Jatrophihabitans telluris]
MTQPPPQLTEISDAPLDSDHFDLSTSGGSARPGLGWAPPPAPTPAQRIPWWRHLVPRTIAGRLLAFVVTLVILVVTSIGAATYLALRPVLYDKLDQQLSTAANAEALKQILNSGNSSVVGGAQDIWISFIFDNGTTAITLSSHAGIHTLRLSPDAEQRLTSDPTKPHTVSTTDGVELRALAVPLDYVNLSQPGGYGLVGISTQYVRDTLGRLLALEVAIGAAAVAIAAGATAWGVRVGLRPLYRVTRTAQEVTAELGPDGEGLDRRVDVADPTTEVGQVASSVNTLLEAVQTEFAARVSSEDRMRQFLADASHELRTPLTSIRGYAELSRLQGRHFNDPDDPMLRIEVEGTRMSRLVEDLLVLARGDDRSAEVLREAVEVDMLLADAVSSVRSAHPERAFELAESGGAVVLGDRDQLVRLLVNLLNNAAVHTSPDGPIRLEGVRGSTAAGPAVALRVIDRGPGLPPEEAEHVFERFWRADKARSRARGGSGLGMAIVAQIAEAHAGTVDFTSSVERGTVVTVLLPLAGVSAVDL